jgi:hypothetical protein
MLKIEKVNDQKIYTIKNKYLCENGVLNEKNEKENNWGCRE